MDIVTQAILGAAVGQAGFQHKLGRKAVAWGAVYGVIPDFDIITQVSGNPFAEQLYHRGFTHSLFFAPLVAPLVAILMTKYTKSKDYWTWLWLIFWALITHPLLDVFTHYGTQLLNPLSNHRFSLAAISVIDLVYSLPLLLAVLVGLKLRNHILARSLTSVTLLLTTSYLFYGIACNSAAIDQARQDLGAAPYRLESYPILFQIHLRRVVAHYPGKVKVGLASTYPGTKYPIKWFEYRNDQERGVDEFLSTPEIRLYKWFCAGDCVVNKEGDVIKLYDLRFGIPGTPSPGIWGVEKKNGSKPKPFRLPYTEFYHGNLIDWIGNVIGISFGGDPSVLVGGHDAK